MNNQNTSEHDNAVALLKLISISEKDKKEGRTMSGDQLLTKIKTR